MMYDEINHLLLPKGASKNLRDLQTLARKTHPQDIPEGWRDFLVYLIATGAEMVKRTLEVSDSVLVKPATAKDVAALQKQWAGQGEYKGRRTTNA